MGKLWRFLLRGALLLAGLVFLVSLLFAVLVMPALWLLRAIWARLNGRPVNRWTLHIDRQAVWNRFYRAPGQRPANQSDVADVIDVEVKERPR